MVTLGATHERQWIVNNGLKQGERVIAEGLQKVRPGMEVEVTSAAADEPAS
jgi:membrane fusion protein (multidrug efflux system)